MCQMIWPSGSPAVWTSAAGGATLAERPAGDTFQLPHLLCEHPIDKSQAFELTVRPALDSPSAALDRAKMNIYIAVRPSLHLLEPRLPAASADLLLHMTSGHCRPKGQVNLTSQAAKELAFPSRYPVVLLHGCRPAAPGIIMRCQGPGACQPS